MNSEVRGHLNTEPQPPVKAPESRITPAIAPLSRRDVRMRNFILQMGFDDPAPAIRPAQYAALTFQPRVVLIAVAAGIVFQSPAIFAVLGALLWSSAFFPNLNAFSAVYNRTFAKNAFRLGPAPAPRRGAETMAGAFAFAIAVLLLAGFSLTAFVLEAIFLAASSSPASASARLPITFGADTRSSPFGRFRGQGIE